MKYPQQLTRQILRKTAAYILLMLCSQNLFSQIDNCSECDTKVYAYQDISNLSLLELKVLRNEVFARHQYVFKDSRLSDYFLEKFNWYKPDFNKKNNIQLNTIEKQNISLLLKYETKKEALKKTIISELTAFKLAIKKNDTAKINSIINKGNNGSQRDYSYETIGELKAVLSVININGIHWYNEKGLYKITTDDGHFISEESITINKNQIILKMAYMGYSELLNDETAFKFGSDFDSTNEYVSWFVLEIVNNKLLLKEHQAAG